jgi:hypothetical protein
MIEQRRMMSACRSKKKSNKAATFITPMAAQSVTKLL